MIGSLATLNSCKKGDTGPAGKDGVDGNANVTSLIVTISSSQWTFSNNEYDATISVPAITQSIITSGTVQVFCSPDGANWLALPFSFQGYEINYGYLVGQVQIAITLNNGGNPGQPNNNQFKIIVISSAARIAHPNVNWNNYNEVKKIFNLAD